MIGVRGPIINYFFFLIQELILWTELSILHSFKLQEVYQKRYGKTGGQTDMRTEILVSYIGCSLPR